MAKAPARPAKITEEHEKEAARLRALWERKQIKSQLAFALEYGIGTTQGAVWRFLNGKDPLSLKAAKGFAKGLHCQISDFSPRLANEIAEYATYMGSAPAAAVLTPQEAKILQAFNRLAPAVQDGLLQAASAITDAGVEVSGIAGGRRKKQPAVKKLPAK